jgi:hypothetical protein
MTRATRPPADPQAAPTTILPERNPSVSPSLDHLAEKIARAETARERSVLQACAARAAPSPGVPHRHCVAPLSEWDRAAALGTSVAARWVPPPPAVGAQMGNRQRVNGLTQEGVSDCRSNHGPETPRQPSSTDSAGTAFRRPGRIGTPCRSEAPGLMFGVLSSG